MIDYLGKSVKSLYHNLSPEMKSEIESVKILSLLMSNDDNKNESIVIFLSLPGNQLNAYQMMVDYSIEFQCIYSNKFSFSITDIEALNSLSKYKEERPVIAIISNSLGGNNSNKSVNCIHFISLKNDNVLLSLDYPSLIYSTCFKQKYYGVGLSNGSITIYDNNSLKPKCVIDTKGTRFIDNKELTNPLLSQSIPTQNQKIIPLMEEKGNAFYSIYPEMKSSISIKESITSNNISNSYNNMSSQEIRESSSHQSKFQSLYLNQDISMLNYSNKEEIFIPIFDLTENCIIYHINNKNKTVSDPPQSGNPSSSSSSSAFDIAFNALKNLKEWSLKSINDYSSLLKSTNIKTNDDIAKLKVTPLYINVLNLSISSEKELNEKIDKITVPFFKDGLSTIQAIKNGKYIIIGNKNSQLFFVYELYPQTNLKYSNEGQNYKIIYSLFRGNRATHIASLDITKSFSVITSQRGTHHVYSLPIRDQQIIENITESSIIKHGSLSSTLSSPSPLMNYGNDYLNQKITNGIEISTLRQIGQVFYSKIVSIDKVYLDNSIIAKISSTDSNSNNRFSSVVRNENFLITICDNNLEIHLLYNYDKMISLKKQKLILSEDKEIIKSNFAVNLQPEPIQVSKIQMNKRFLVETDTTDKNFSIMQTNPLFTFNLLSLNHSISTEKILIIECPILFSILNIPINYNERKSVALFQQTKFLNDKSETYLYESFLCKDQTYLPINKKKNSKDSNNPKSKNRKSFELYSEMLSAKKIIINPQENYNSIDIKNNFYNNKDIILETNIKNALETNIKDNISNKNSVKKPEDFVIQDNYYQ